MEYISQKIKTVSPDFSLRSPGRTRNIASFRWLINVMVVVSLAFSWIPQQAFAPPTGDDVEDAIREIANEELIRPPSLLREDVYGILFPIAVINPEPEVEQHVLPMGMVDLMLYDSENLFVDESRVASSLVLEHDWDLGKRITKLLKDQGTSSSDADTLLQGLLDLLRADRYIAELTLLNASQVIQNARLADEASKKNVNKAEATLKTAENRHQSGMDALRRGDGDSAIHHFSMSVGFSLEILGIWGIDFVGDHDQDGLLDILELRVHSSVFQGDTDGDGLSDAYEFYSLMPFALPDSADTDGDGQTDAVSDVDSDGLPNIVERDIGTDPLTPDTDNDTVDDFTELTHPGLDPLEADSDHDGLEDASELRLGTNPSHPDSDGDGIPDGDDTHEQTVEDASLGVAVWLVGVGDHSLSFGASSLAEVSGLQDVPGLIGHFVSLSTELPYTSARVRMQYDPSSVPGGDVNNLRLLQFDPESGLLEVLEATDVNSVLNEVSASTDVLGPVGVIYLPTWEDAADNPVMVGLDRHTKPALSQQPGPSVFPAVYQPFRHIQAEVMVYRVATTGLSASPTATPLPPPLSTPSPSGTEGDSNSTEPTETPADLQDASPTATPADLQDASPTATPTPTEATEEVPPEELQPIPPLEIESMLESQTSRFGMMEASAKDGVFPVAESPEAEGAPVAVYDSANDRYLVVWVKDEEPSKFYGRILSDAGVPEGPEFLIMSSQVDVPDKPDLEFNEVDGTFLLSWQERNGLISIETYAGTITYEIPRANLYTLPLDASGTPLVATPQLVTDELTDFDPRYEFDVAYNSIANEFMAVWVQPRGGILARIVHPHHLAVQRLTNTGVPVGAKFVLRTTVASDVRASFSPTSNVYFLTYSLFFSHLGYEIYGYRLNGDSLSIVGSSDVSNLRYGWQFLPEIAYNPLDDQFFPAWHDNPTYPDGFGHIRGQRIRAANGQKLYPMIKVLESPDQGIFLAVPGMEFSPVETRYLVTAGIWTSPELTGQYMSNEGELELEPFLLASAAFQESIAARVEGRDEAPRWLVVWNHFSDIFGTMLPETVISDEDTDHDGFSDSQEVTGFLSAFRTRIVTDPLKGDTDGEGWSDDEEVGAEVTIKGLTFWTMLADPTDPDTDNDGVDDFVERVDLPRLLQPYLPDTDHDRLSDGAEVYTYGTDPREKDTDGDGHSDYQELVNGDDPLFYTERLTVEQGIAAFRRGALCGEFCLGDEGNDNIPFFVGFLLVGVTVPLADVRDAIAAFIHEDYGGALLNLAGVLPIGDLLDVKKGIRFLARNVDLVAEGAAVIARLDELPAVIRANALFIVWGDEVEDGLRALGFADDDIVRLVAHGIEGPTLYRVISNLPDGQDLTRFPEFLDDALDNDVGGVLPHLRGLSAAEPGSVTGYVNNVKGAYTDWVVESLKHDEGWDFLRGRRHINANGYDQILGGSEGAARLVESKSVQELPTKKIGNYIREDEVTGGFLFNDDYFIKELEKLREFDPQAADALHGSFNAGKLEIEIVLNGPRSRTIKETLSSALGSEFPYFKYYNDDDVVRTIELIISDIDL
jgi:hypothetical protein